MVTPRLLNAASGVDVEGSSQTTAINCCWMPLPKGSLTEGIRRSTITAQIDRYELKGTFWKLLVERCEPKPAEWKRGLCRTTITTLHWCDHRPDAHSAPFTKVRWSLPCHFPAVAADRTVTTSLEASLGTDHPGVMAKSHAKPLRLLVRSPTSLPLALAVTWAMIVLKPSRYKMVTVETIKPWC